MPRLAFGKSAYRRADGNFVELKLVNMFTEGSPTAKEGSAILSREGLSQAVTRGAGPIAGLYQQDGVLDGATFTLSDNVLYSDETALGPVTGTGPVSWAGSALQLLIARGGPLWRTAAAVPVAVVFPDEANVTAVVYLAGLFVAIRSGTHRFYWSAALDGSTWDGFDFASAESSPDEVLDVIVVNEELWFLGSATIEPWGPTGDGLSPFSRREGRIIRKGVRATGCAEYLDNTLFWIGSDHAVYRAAQVPQAISDAGMEERIAASVGCSAFAFDIPGHKFFCIRLDTGTWAYDAATGQWCEFRSYGLPNWRVSCAASVAGSARLGDAIDGRVWRLDGHSDAGGEMERLFTAALPIDGGGVSIDTIDMDINSGATALLAGQGSNPLIELRTSRDAARTWGPWRQMSMGAQGGYRARARARRMGLFDAPGAVFEFRTADPVPLRVSAVLANEPGGGRGR